MVAADTSSTTTKPNSKVSSPAKPKRVPLLPSASGSDNNGRSLQRPTKPKDVSSRYLSSNSVSTPTNRFPSSVSPPVTSASPASNKERHTGTVEMSASAKMLTKTSVRSLSVSFQGQSFALPVSNVGKPANNGSKNDTPQTKKSPETKTKLNGSDTRLPMRSPQRSFMTMSVDYTNAKTKLNRSETTEAKLLKLERTNLESAYNSDGSDSESISSGNDRGGGGARAIVVPARFWQETINLLRRVQAVPVSAPLVKNSKPMSGCKGLHEGLKGGSSSSPGPVSNISSGMNSLSILSFCADLKRGKVGEKKLEEAHLLRVLHNKHMQWRFANAKADAAMLVQRAAVQKNLYNAWVTISKLWHSVISKRLQIQELNHNLKLHALLKKQILYLDNWDLTERDHSISLSGAIMALESSSLCLPVAGDAKADIQNLKDAIFSAVDVMQAMAVSVYSLLDKVENVNSMASELVNAMKTECSLLDQCKDLLSTLTLLEKQDCSLRTHTLQIIPPPATTQQRKLVSF